jgi:hypothetical protein
MNGLNGEKCASENASSFLSAGSCARTSTMHREADRTSFKDLPESPEERHEKMLHFLGQDLMAHKENAMTLAFRHLEGAKPGSGLLPYDAKFFEAAAAKLDPEQREIAKKLCSRVLTNFMESFMTMICCHGRNNLLGSEHGLQYHLTVDVCHYPRTKNYASKARHETSDDDADESDDPIGSFVPVDADEGNASASEEDTYGRVCESHDLAHGGELHFPQYWYRWMNKFKAF